MLIKKVQQIVERIPGVIFLYDDWGTINLRLERVQKVCEDKGVLPDVRDLLPGVSFPCIFVLLQGDGTLSTRNGNVRDVANLRIGFVVDADNNELDGLTNAAKIKWMVDLATTFIHLYNKSGMFEPLPNEIDYTNLYQLFNATVTGVLIDIKAKEVIGSCYPGMDYPDPVDPTKYCVDCGKYPPEYVKKFGK